MRTLRWSISPRPESPKRRRAAEPGRAVALACLAAVAGAAWLWLLRAPMIHGAETWSAAYLLPAVLMWAVMMVAMMLPSATPMILLYGRVAAGRAGPRRPGRTLLFGSAYLALWLLFACAAALMQAALVAGGAASDMTLAIGDRGLAGALLVAAGLYEVTPVKRACLDTCRAPLAFLIRLWRPGTAGALRLGLAHGAYCIGCCWALMLMLFVGGVMDLAWIGGLALLVLAEKLAPPRWRVPELAAGGLILAGGWLLLTR